MNSMGQVTDVGGGLLGHRNVWRWRNLDVSSARCNNHPPPGLLWDCPSLVWSRGVVVVVSSSSAWHCSCHGCRCASGVGHTLVLLVKTPLVFLKLEEKKSFNLDNSIPVPIPDCHFIALNTKNNRSKVQGTLQ